MVEETQEVAALTPSGRFAGINLDLSSDIYGIDHTAASGKGGDRKKLRPLQYSSILINRDAFAAKKLLVGRREMALETLTELLIEPETRKIVITYISTIDFIDEVFGALIRRDLEVRKGRIYFNVLRLRKEITSRLPAGPGSDAAADAIMQMIIMCLGRAPMIDQKHPGFEKALPTKGFEASLNDILRAAVKSRLYTDLGTIDFDISSKLTANSYSASYVPQEVFSVLRHAAMAIEESDKTRRYVETSLALVRDYMLAPVDGTSPHELESTTSLRALSENVTFVNLALTSQQKFRMVRPHNLELALSQTYALFKDSDVVEMPLDNFMSSCGHYTVRTERDKKTVVQGLVTYFDVDVQHKANIYWAYENVAGGDVFTYHPQRDAREVFNPLLSSLSRFNRPKEAAADMLNPLQFAVDGWDRPMAVRVSMSPRMVELYSLALNPRVQPVYIEDENRLVHLFAITKPEIPWEHMGHMLNNELATYLPEEVIVLTPAREPSKTFVVAESSLDITPGSHVLAGSLFTWDSFKLDKNVERTFEVLGKDITVDMSIATGLGLDAANTYQLLADTAGIAQTRSLLHLWLDILKSVKSASSDIDRSDTSVRVSRDMYLVALRIMEALEPVRQSMVVRDLISATRASIIEANRKEGSAEDRARVRNSLRTAVMNSQMEYWVTVDLLRRFGYILGEQADELSQYLDESQYHEQTRYNID